MTSNSPLMLEVAQARALLARDADVQLVDVRSPAEFAAVSIPGSHNVPLRALRRQRGHALSGSASHIVLVCASGARAARAREQLSSAGVDRVSVLDGGITAWERHGGPVSRGSAAGWSMERQVRLVAGALVLTGVLASTAYEPLKWLAAFIGAGLTFSGLTDTCGMARVLALLPYNQKQRCDVPAATVVPATRTAPDGG